MADTRASSAKMGGPRPKAGGSGESAAFTAVNRTLAELTTAIHELKAEVANIKSQS